MDRSVAAKSLSSAGRSSARLAQQAQQATQLRSDENKVFIQAYAARFKPVRFDKLVEELCSALAQVSELAALVVVEMNIRVVCQHLANEQACLCMPHLSALVSRFCKTFCAVHVDGRGRPRQWTEKPTTQDG